MRLGFIGTGTITEAIVTGLCRVSGSITDIWLSPRGRETAACLSQTHGIVRTATSNQAVTDNADIVFLAFLPGMEEEILKTLVFKKDQTIVTLLAGIPLDRVACLVSPARNIVRAVPLPCTALNTGPVVIYPHNTAVQDIFSRVGSVIIPERENQLEIFSLITAFMAPFYALTDTIAAWGADKGLDRTQSAAYTGSMFKALALIAETEPEGNIQRLIKSAVTPGELNETAMAHLSARGGFSGVSAALDAVADRFQA